VDDFDHAVEEANGTCQRPPDAHRLLPASVEAERGCLSSYLLAPAEVGTLYADIGLTRDHFHVPAHATIFQRLQDMQGSPDAPPIDTISLTAWLRSRRELDLVGGPAAITELFTFLPTAVNASYYAKLVKDARTLREVIRVCTKYSSGAYEHPPMEEIEPLLSEITEAIGRAMGQEQSKLVSPKQAAMEFMLALKEAHETRHDPKDVTSTGYRDIDRALGGGLRPDDSVLLTGPTKGGKSILAKCIGEYIAIEKKKPVCLFSLEMNRRSQMHRIYASQARVSAHRMRGGFLSEGDFPALTRASTRFAESKFYVRDDCFDLSRILAGCRHFKRLFPDTALFIFDYAQLIDAKKDRGENRENVVARISTALRRVTLELGVAGLILSQENKDGDARESSRLEQDCTCRLKIEKEGSNPAERTISVPLARNGPRCEFKMVFMGDIMRFENHAKQPEDEGYASQ
jgi:replicative DNA helicase